MKGQKKTLFILIPVVLLVWILIIYRVFSVIYPNRPVEIVSVFQPYKVIPKVLIKESLITGDYRDPFLPAVIIRKSNNSGKIVKPKVVAPIIIEQWPKVEYFGFVNKNELGNTPLLYIKINGKSRYLKSGDTKEELKIAKVFKDSIEVIFQNESKYIYSRAKLRKK